MSDVQASASQLDASPASAAPVRKVAAGGLAGALAVILVFVLNTYVLPAGKPITGDIAASLTTILTFIVSYMVPSAAIDRT